MFLVQTDKSYNWFCGAFSLFFLGDFHIQVSGIPVHALGPDSFLGYAGMRRPFHSVDIWHV